MGTKLKYVNTKNAPEAIGPYSQAVIFRDMLFTSGQIPLDPNTGQIAGETIEKQTLQVLRNIDALLSENNISEQNVIKTTCFLSDMKDFEVFNTVYADYFHSNPARSCVAVKTLPKNVLCEIEVIAILDSLTL